MSIKIDISTSLQHLTDDVDVVEVNGSTVGECLEDLIKQFPKMKQHLFDENGKLDMFGNIYINGERNYPEGLATKVNDGDELYISNIVAGG